MTNEDGKYTTQDLSLQEIYEAAKSDHDNLPKLRDREDGWRLFAELMNDINSDTSSQMPNVRKSFDSAAGRVYQQQFGDALTNVSAMASAAELNRKYAGETIAEVERVWPRIEEIKDDHDLAVANRNTLASQEDPETGNDGYSQAMQDTVEEARAEFATSNTTYADTTSNTIEPYEYKGPTWEGRKPRTSLDDYQHAYYPDGGAVSGRGDGGGYAANGGSSTPAPDASNPDQSSTGPELQTPGGTTTTTPTPSGTATPVSTGSGNVPPGFVGGPATSPTGGGAKPVTPPTSLKAGPNGAPPAKPTPGMGSQRPLGNGTARPLGTGGSNAGNTTAKNGQLPNQRQAAAGRTPVTGSMRGGANPARPVVGGQSARRGAAAKQETTGRIANKPNGGFEESMHRNTRGQRTVPGVVRGARGSAPETTSGRGGGASIGKAGKVIGARKNKATKKSAPQFRRGSLTGSVSKKDTKHQWSRVKPVPSTEPPAGSIVLNRREVTKPLSLAEEKRRKWQDRRQRRRELYAGKQREQQPETDLFGGYEGRVVPGVIRPTVYPQRVDEQDAGARFSTHGWEGRQ